MKLREFNDKMDIAQLILSDEYTTDYTCIIMGVVFVGNVDVRADYESVFAVQFRTFRNNRGLTQMTIIEDANKARQAALELFRVVSIEEKTYKKYKALQ